MDLLAQRDGLAGRLLFGAACRHALLGDALTGKGELQVDGQCREDRHCQHGDEPQVLVLFQCEGDQHGEHHGAAAHHAQTGNVGEGSKRTALLAVRVETGIIVEFAVL